MEEEPQVIVDDAIENFCRISGEDIRFLARKAYNHSILCGYKPANKFNIVGSAPNHTVANKEAYNLVNIHLDQTLPLKYIHYRCYSCNTFMT